jgi:hypothetical protein
VGSNLSPSALSSATSDRIGRSGDFQPAMPFLLADGYPGLGTNQWALRADERLQ